jgi:hydroxymethylpyrimidine/phosphomethylpyrimidine kinase
VSEGEALRVRRVLAIGGSDSGGGAGIQADVKTLHALGVHASTVVTAVTAQTSTAVTDIHDVPVESIRAQLAAVLSDLGADVVKTGMLSSPGAVLAVLEALGSEPLVIDPVGVSSTGRALLAPAALELLRTGLLPRATVVTPNLAEVAALTGVLVEDQDGLLDAARAVHALGPAWVLVKGGHLRGRPTDLLYDGREAIVLEGERVRTEHTHGTGCVLASALAAHLALGADVPTAARAAKAFVTEAIRKGYALGLGPGPVRP